MAQEQLGRHVIADFWGCRKLHIDKVKQVLRKAVEKCGATLLHLKAHAFDSQGVSAFALISESHISIHTWPEFEFVAIDIFTCGERVDPYKALEVLVDSFKPQAKHVLEVPRGDFENGWCDMVCGL